MIWRPLAFLAALSIGTAATLELWAFLVIAYDLNPTVQLLLLFAAFAGFCFASWNYIKNAGSVSRVRSQSWRAAKVLAVLAVALSALAVWGWFGGRGPADRPTVLTCSYCSLVPVTRIIDGDTLVSGNEHIRLYGIDAPEVGERCADGATRRLAQLAGDEVRIEMGPRNRDVYGRLLAYVYTVGGDSVDERLVGEGHAVAWTRDGQHREFIMDLEQEAKATGIGCLW